MEGAYPDRIRWGAALTALSGTFLAVMDISVVNVALPHMMGSFSEDLSAITWVATSYSIAEILLATMAGWWSQLLGRKRLYLASMALFTAGSILAGTSQSFTQMLVFRTIQGIGGGALIPVSLTILRESFPEEKQGMAMAVYGMGVVLAPAFGPVLGGWLTDHYGWPAIFFINVPIGVVAMLLVVALVHDPAFLRRGLKRIDWVGIALLTFGLTGAQIVLERGQELNWFESNLVLFGSIVTGSALVALVWWDLRVSEPVVDFRLLKNIPLSVGSTIGLFFGLALFGTTFMLPQFTQELLGYPAYQAGLVLMPRALALFLFMPIAGSLYGKIDARILVLAGLGIIFWSYLGLSRLSLQAGFWTIVPILALMGVGMPFMFVTLTTVSLSTVPPPDMTHASSLYTLSRRVGGNIGYALVSTLIARGKQIQHSHLAEHVTPYDIGYRMFHGKATDLFASRGLDKASAAKAATALVGRTVHVQATVLSYDRAAWIMGILFLLTAPLILFLPASKRRPPETNVVPS